MFLPHTIPTEIWAIIIAFAVEVPGLFDTSFLPPLDDSPRSWVETRSETAERTESEIRKANTQTSFATKKTISLVCKSFLSLIRPHLFEHLVLIPGPLCTALSSVLHKDLVTVSIQNLNPNPPATSRMLFSRIQRVDVSVPPVQEGASDEDWDQFLSILSLCDNIHILNFNPDDWVDVPTLVMDTFTRYRRLRHLEWCDLRGEIFEILPHSACLEVLILKCDAMESLAVEDYPIMSLPRLHTFGLGGHAIVEYLPIFQAWNLPTLSRVSINASADGMAALDDFLQFFQKFGSQIVSLNLLEASNTSIGRILSCCKALQHLLFNQWRDDVLPYQFPRTIRRLSFALPIRFTDNRDLVILVLSDFLVKLERWILATSVSLTSVRLLEVNRDYFVKNPPTREEFKLWMSIIQSCRIANVWLEYHTGEPIELHQLNRITLEGRWKDAGRFIRVEKQVGMLVD
jgi:hypothetical protein